MKNENDYRVDNSSRLHEFEARMKQGEILDVQKQQLNAQHTANFIASQANTKVSEINVTAKEANIIAREANAKADDAIVVAKKAGKGKWIPILISILALAAAAVSAIFTGIQTFGA